MASCSISAGDAFFGVGYWLLAVFFHDLSNNMPKNLAHEKPASQEAAIKRSSPKKPLQTSAVNWIFIVLNIAVPVFECAFGVYLASISIDNEKIVKAYNYTIATIGLLQIVSGFLLVTALIKIVGALQSKKAKFKINTKTLMVNVTSIAVFCLGVIPYTVYRIGWNIEDNCRSCAGWYYGYMYSVLTRVIARIIC